MTGLKVIDGTPTAISKFLREKEMTKETNSIKKRGKTKRYSIDYKKIENETEGKLDIIIKNKKGVLNKKQKFGLDMYDKGWNEGKAEAIKDEIIFIENCIKYERIQTVDEHKFIERINYLKQQLQEQEKSIKEDEEFIKQLKESK